MNQPIPPSTPIQPLPPANGGKGGVKKLLIFIAIAVVIAVVVFVVTQNRSETEPGQEQNPPVATETDPQDDQPKAELTLEQIRQLHNEVQEVAELDPTDQSAYAATVEQMYDGRRQILTEIEIYPIDDYTPKTELGRMVKEMLLELPLTKDTYQELVDCQLSEADFEQFLTGLTVAATQALELNQKVLAEINSDQPDPDLLEDLKRLTPFSVEVDLELYDTLPPSELPEVIVRCYGGVIG